MEGTTGLSKAEPIDQYRYIVNVGAAVVRDGKYLLIVRSAEMAHAPDTLAFPGGKVDPGVEGSSPLEATALRELLEETGVEAHDNPAYVQSNAFIRDDGHPVINVTFLCRWRSGEGHAATAAEVAGVEWLTAAQIASHPTAPPWTKAEARCAEQLRLTLGWR